jgi:glutathione synthase/RimK-type ligase-like ATP-grasp enzyme
MRKVLIFGHPEDPHIKKVAKFLLDFECQIFIFDRFCESHLISLSISNTGPGGYLQIDGQRIELNDIDAVWWRVKPIVTSEVTGSFEKVAEEFASREWRVTMRALPSFIRNAFWVNPLIAQQQINPKPHQLALASSIGLRLPNSVFTNDVASVASLFHDHERLIYKTVSWFIFPPDEVIYTTEITKDIVTQSHRKFARAPGTYQELVEKSYELRVTVIGDEVFAVRINSQAWTEARIDWRHCQFENMFEPCDLDEDTRSKILEFHSSAGLVIGAYDLIVPNTGRPVFLECNPSGQWLWLEENLNLPISQALARILSNCTSVA